MFDWFVAWLSWMLPIGAVMAVLAVYIETKKEARITVKESDYEKIEYLLQTRGFSISQLDYGLTGGIALDESNKRIAIIFKAHNEIGSGIIEPENILGVELIKNGTTITRTLRSSQVGGAVVGGLALGPAGAILGGLSGKQESQEQVTSIAIMITTRDLSAPTTGIYFSPISGGPTAERWYAIIRIIIEATDKLIPIGSDNLKQIEKMADLRDRGILTTEEFEEKKKVLLANL